jgi:hypothetical protein
MKNQKMTIPSGPFFSTLFRAATTGLLVLAMLLAAAGSKAACGDPRSPRPQTLTMPWLNHGNHDQDNDERSSFPTIVGLWQLVYTADDGSTFLKSFKTWHADGTEFENAFLPPGAGNICFGVWKEVAHRTVRLHHVGLMFDANGISGTFTVDETDTVEPDGKTYKGTFVFKAFDPGGRQVAEVKGTTLGTRITVD